VVADPTVRRDLHSATVTLVRINWEHWRLGALRLSVSNTVLVFLVIPLGVILVVASLVFAASDKTRRTRRYRPGRPYDFQPIWFLASPEQVAHTAPALTGDQSRQALESSVLEDSAGQRVKAGSTGGASDSW
jgi:hypothetical protein